MRSPVAPAVLFFLASITNLALANLIVFRVRRTRGALPIALLCVSLFLWDMGEAAHAVFEAPHWKYVALVGSSMAPAFLFHFVVVFVHRERPWRFAVWGLYATTAIFTSMTAAALFSVRAKMWVDDRSWNIAYLVSLFPFLLISLALARMRLREVDTPVERNAVNFMAMGILVGAVTGLADLIVILGSPIPPLGHFGSAACAVILAIAILRHRLLESETPVRRALAQFFIASGAVLLIFFLYTRVQRRWDDLFILGAAVVTVSTMALYRFLWSSWYEQQERRKRLALLGTMAASVAHEVKNPLASIKGAAQFVEKDLGETKPESREYLKLLVGEVDRLNGVVEDFLTFARPLEPRRQDVPVNGMLANFLKLQVPSMPAGVTVETAFAEDLPPIAADPQLLRHAVSNVFKNAVEAVGPAGTVTVRTRPVTSAMRAYVAIEIADTGPGVRMEDVEQIFQPFYTTKSKGTGLGLAIAKRIVESHGGEIGVEAVAPRGCRFTLVLPVRGL